MVGIGAGHERGRRRKMGHKVERDAEGNKLPHRTRRERFLEEMDAVIPWKRLVGLIEPHYPKAGNGRPPQPLETMLRIHFLQHFFNLSDPGAEDALYDSVSMRRFAPAAPELLARARQRARSCAFAACSSATLCPRRSSSRSTPT